MTELAALLIVIILLFAAMLVVTLQNWIAVLAASGIVSLGLSVLFVLLKAPDVAMTEAAVGAGLGSLIFALAMRRLGVFKTDTKGDGHA